MPRNQVYVLARSESGRRQDLVFGDFANCSPGSRFGREPRVYGDEPWVVIRKYGHDEQRLIDALTLLLGNDGFKRLADLFRID